MTYLAHKNENGKEQSVQEHCEAVGRKAQDFAVEVLKPFCLAMGKLHDVGKYQASFQKRIRGENIRVEHSICGALLAGELYGKGQTTVTSWLLQLCIAGHHSGIPDCGTPQDSPDMSTLYGRLRRETEDFSIARQELTFPELSEKDLQNDLAKDCTQAEDLVEKFAFFTRYAFSCLTDADSLDTAEFMTGTPRKPLKADFTACLERIEQYLKAFENQTQTPLQKARTRLQQQVYTKLKEPQAEVYLMNMPTGSGKTLCSMKFALERALAGGKKRILYVIPYNSIIDQTAALFEQLFEGCAQVLRHQSTFAFEDMDSTEDEKEAALLACENWDAQIIITTAVQFFESLYANKRSKLRKLHNMANSILVFDEAHLMPVDFLQPCLTGISYLCRFLGSEAIFLTATMPDYTRLIQNYALKNLRVRELISDSQDFALFQKCRYTYMGALSDEALLMQAGNAPSCLIVVNSRKAARELYALGTGKKYHLSTWMTAYDRMRVIAEIRQALTLQRQQYPDLTKVPQEEHILVISTSLIEAGVDLDFYTVFRQLAGLDNILQAGGRCNREGLREKADVKIFQREKDIDKSQDERSSLTRGILQEFEDISAPDAVRTYYERLFFSNRDKITQNAISRKCKKIQLLPFAEYSHAMKLIDDHSLSIAVAVNEESRALLKTIEQTGKAPTRRLQKYCLSVRPYELEALLQQGVLADYDSGVWCLTNEDYYDPQTGIQWEASDYYLD